MRSIASALAIAFAMTCLPSDFMALGADLSAKVDWVSGKKFDQALDQPVVATWQNAEFRSAVRALSDQRLVPVMLDRRLDPNRMFSLETQGNSLRNVWPQLANVVDGGVSNTGQTIYLGPRAASGKLRTLLALRQDEIQQVASKLPTSRRKPLLAKRPLHWDDLDSPHDIVQRLSRDYGVEVTGLEKIPHDLWSAADVPPITLAEAATLVLIQVDLTFQIKSDDESLKLELVPIPAMVALEKTLPLPRTKREAIAQAIQAELPDVATQATGEQVTARGTQEQLEELEQLIRNVSTGASTRIKSTGPPALSRRRFTFTAKDAKLSAILDKLAQTGIQFEYDRDSLKRAGIDIDILVAVDAKDVSPEELFEKLFKPLKIKYDIDGLKVRLAPEH